MRLRRFEFSISSISSRIESQREARRTDGAFTGFRSPIWKIFSAANLRGYCEHLGSWHAEVGYDKLVVLVNPFSTDHSLLNSICELVHMVPHFALRRRTLLAA